MESFSAPTASSELRRSIRYLLAESDYELELESLLAVIRDDPELVRIAEAELAPRNGHLELHLDGGSVKGHATVAKSFGQFVTRMADATKAAVREMAGLAALPDELTRPPRYRSPRSQMRLCLMKMGTQRRSAVLPSCSPTPTRRLWTTRISTQLLGSYLPARVIICEWRSTKFTRALGQLMESSASEASGECHST